MDGEQRGAAPPGTGGPPREDGAPPAMAGSPLLGSVTLLLVGAGRVAARRVDAALAELDLTLRHVSALGHLGRNPNLSYSDLARRAGITTQSMHATVRHLEELGAVQRSLPGQGHRARLEVTAHGRELLGRVFAAAEQLDDELPLDPEQRAELRRLLLRAGPV